jgi:2-dehydro-3-deoxyphosphogluconate aldolase/(4S)-4-hydroxy-2-oxoglutarate aldolase
MSQLREMLRLSRVLPVVVVDSEQQALDLGRVLLQAGMTAIEVTLRTPAALAALRSLKTELPDLTVAAGTIRSTVDLEAVAEAGADFAVSPGFTARLSDCARDLGMPFLPGVSTASEVMQGAEAGHQCFKLFPAEAVGGIRLLKSLAAPLAGIEFCPTGGIGPDNFRHYLALPNVLCIGGSWMVAPDLIRQGNWERIAVLARASLAAGEPDD